MKADFKFHGHDFDQSPMVRATRPTILLLCGSAYFYCFLQMEDWAKPYFEKFRKFEYDYIDVASEADFKQ